MCDAGRLAQSWKPYIAPWRVALGHLLVDDAAAGGHPLHVAGGDDAAVAQAVAVLDVAAQHVGDGLDAAVRMPGEALQVLVRLVRAEVVEQQERIEQLRLAEAEGPVEVHAGPLDGRPALDHLADAPVLCH